MELLANPQQLLRLARDGARGLAGGRRRGRAGADARRLADAAEGQAGRRQARGLERAAAAGRVKAIGKALDCSINDVLLACVAGAIGDYLRDAGRRPDRQGDPRDGAGEPAPARPGLRSSATASAWRRWCCRSASPTRSSACTRCAQRMSELKGSYQPLLAFAVLAVAGPADQAGAGRAARTCSRKKATAVMTNVPGPAQAAEVLRLDARARRCSGCRSRATSAWACRS